MRPWMLVAIVAVTFMAAIAARAWWSARATSAFPLGAAPPWAALKALARVKAGTQIDILGFDLRYLVRSEPWGRLVRKWMRKGASIRYLVQESDEADVDLLRGLAAAGGGRLRLFVVRGEEAASDLVRDAADFHFVIFRSPDQLWLEGLHPAGDACAYDCEYVPLASTDERWEARNEDFGALVAKSGERKLTE